MLFIKQHDNDFQEAIDKICKNPFDELIKDDKCPRNRKLNRYITYHTTSYKIAKKIAQKQIKYTIVLHIYKRDYHKIYKNFYKKGPRPIFINPTKFKKEETLCKKLFQDYGQLMSIENL